MPENINFWLPNAEMVGEQRKCLIRAFYHLSVGGCVELKVSVRFFTSLREITGKKEETLIFARNESATVGAALAKLSKRYGKRFENYVFDRSTGGVKGFLQFLVNGRSASITGGLDTMLADGDVLAIIPPVGGG
jgi:MoaD family protein